MIYNGKRCNEVKKTFKHLERFENSRTMENDRNDMENIKFQGEDVLTKKKKKIIKKKKKKKLKIFLPHFSPKKKKKKKKNPFFEVNLKNNGNVAFFFDTSN
jgi:hypothetical protein